MQIKGNSRHNKAPQNRRLFLHRCLQWTGILFFLSLLYPLVRFIDFHPKPKPRFVTVPAPLPARGYHKDMDFILALVTPLCGVTFTFHRLLCGQNPALTGY